MNYLITPRYSINKRGGKRQPSSKQPPAIIQIKENLVMSTLFTAVSVEQQETVAGGYDLAVYGTAFSGTATEQLGGASSGFLGSTAVGGQKALSVNTAAQTVLAANAPANLVVPATIVATRV
jgi:hypothetical protein